MTKLEKNKAFLDSMLGTGIRIKVCDHDGAFLYIINKIVYSEKDDIYVITTKDNIYMIRGYELDDYDFKLADDSLSNFYNDNHPTHEKSEFEVKLSKVLDGMKSLLLYKNRKYGNAALNPICIFNKTTSTNSIYSRLDDKLMRIKNGNEIQKNDVSDLFGYLALLMIDKGWDSFDEFKD